MPEGTNRNAEDDRKASLFLAGDALITRPWSHVRDQRFLKLVAEMRAADVAIVKLERVIHEFKGHAQPESGGTYMASPPMIAGELRWAGVDMASGANNHAFDYDRLVFSKRFTTPDGPA
jgi:poly-gamma-glutamate synthesis protein (capsule biosynthesis protein)